MIDEVVSVVCEFRETRVDDFCAWMRVTPEPSEDVREKLAKVWKMLDNNFPHSVVKYFEPLCKDCKASKIGVNETNLAAALATKIVGYLAQGYEIDGDGHMVLKNLSNHREQIPLYVDAQ